MENITKHPVASFDQLPREVAEAHDKLDLILGLVQGFIDSQKPSGPKMLTAEEAAVFLKKKVSTIYTMNCHGQLPVHHIGNKVVYFEKELLEFIKNNGKLSKDGETIEEHADAVANGMSRKASGTVERNSKADEQKEIELFESQVADYRAGARIFREIAATLTDGPRAEANRMAALGEYLMHSCRTTANLKKGRIAWRKGDRETVRALARDEYENAKAALKVVDEDSRLGWLASSDYTGSRPQIEWKLRKMRELYGFE